MWPPRCWVWPPRVMLGLLAQSPWQCWAGGTAARLWAISGFFPPTLPWLPSSAVRSLSSRRQAAPSAPVAARPPVAHSHVYLQLVLLLLCARHGTARLSLGSVQHRPLDSTCAVAACRISVDSHCGLRLRIAHEHSASVLSRGCNYLDLQNRYCQSRTWAALALACREPAYHAKRLSAT